MVDNVATASINDGPSVDSNPVDHPVAPVKTDTVNEDEAVNSATGKTVRVGDVIHYTVSYTNDTGAPAKMVITDAVPAGTDYVAGTAATDFGGDATIDDAGATISWTLADVPDGAKVTVTFDVKVNKDAITVVDNVATASINDGPSVDSNPVDHPVVKPVKNVVDISGDATKGDGDEVKVGDVIHYSVSYTNNTDAVQKVVITDAVPDGTTFTNADNDGEDVNGTVTWVFEGVPAGSTVTVTFKATVNDTAVTRVDNTAYASIDDGPAVATNVTVNPLPPKSVNVNDSTTTNDDDTVIVVGDTLHYHVDYVNVTGARVDSVVITDVVPAGTDYVEGSASEGGVYDAATNIVTWTLGPVEAGDFVRVDFDAIVNDSATTSVDNHATITVGPDSHETNTVTNPLATPVTDDPPVTKAYAGDSASDATFTFILSQVSNTAGLSSNPMPNGSDAKALETSVTGQSSSEFGVITFRRPGTYVYKVTEYNDGQSSWTYDSETFTLTYVVEQDGQGLKVTKTIAKANGVEADSVTFTNTYSASNPPKVVKKTPFTGDETLMGTMAILVLSAGALFLASGVIRKRRDRRSQD